MSQQGGRPTGPEDDWWGQLYDDSTDDTGPTAAPDSLDDRFASASGTVTDGSGNGPPAVPGPRAGSRWEPPPTTPAAPSNLPPPPAGSPAPARPDHPRSPAPPPAAVPPPAAAEPTDGSHPSAPRDGAQPADGPGTAPSPDTSRPPRPPGDARPPAPPPSAPPPDAPRPPDPPRPDTSSPARPRPAPPWQPLPSASHRTEPPRQSPAPSSPQPEPPPPPWAPDAAPGQPCGRTASGSGPADLREPPEVGLPPLPPPFLPSAAPRPLPEPGAGAARDFVGSGPPTYDPEPTALPAADPDGLDDLVPDTVLDGARYGTCTLRAVSVRGDSARYRGEPRRDALLVARFGAGEHALVLVAMATGTRATAGAHRAAAEVCRWIGAAVGRSHARLAEDLRAARRGDLKSGLHRLTDRSLGRLRAGAAEQGLSSQEYAASLRCLILPADPACRTRVFFGVGPGGLLRLRDGTWRDMEPTAGDVTGAPVLGFGSLPRGTPADRPSETPDGDRLTMDLGVTAPPGPYDAPPPDEPPRRPFRFRASVARPGDVLLMCTTGLAEPMLTEPELGGLLARRWTGRTPPGLGDFLADTGVRVKGYADDRTAAAVWEA
ncbi:protein phosphatase 2C domain-containing protein [Streptomyces sp. NBC_01723]|uniref:protein phosphatase 2C domain-containing protein n=1 Tax=Streptomyces sp. NBC_01723 TaxID=2975921 RepID=UPI002E356C47|nr:protein phosphatase 2C domain-containing protein [Streptomyces sp. NBC_01723]